MTELDDLASRLADVAVAAATAVAKPLRDAFRAGVDVAYERDHHDPVTVHDRLAEERIRDDLTAEVPDSVVVGEESGASGAGGRVRWYVDPVGGTVFRADTTTSTCDGEPLHAAGVATRDARC